MSQWPLDGQPGEDDDLPEDVEPGGTDDAIEGTVVPFPTQPGTEVEPKRKPGGPGELRPIVPEHLRTVAGIRKAARWRAHRWRHIFLPSMNCSQRGQMRRRLCAYLPVRGGRGSRALGR